MDSKTYWKMREQEQLKYNIRDEVEYTKHIRGIYDYMMDQIQKEINGFYVRYAAKEGLTLAEAKRKAAQMDIKSFARKAQKYVAEKDFSKAANEELRLYNLTMKVNRLELLKANIGLELVSGYDELQKYFDQILTDRTLDEFERQAGILGGSLSNNSAAAHAVVNASFHHATFSDRIWMYQGMMKNDLASLLVTGLIQGRGPRELARHLTKRFGVSKNNAERLMVTELARVQTEAQKQSFERNGFEEYTFLALSDACGECAKLDGQHFKVKKMLPGTNAPPMHPRCRCSTASYMDDAEYDAWLDGFSEHGLSFEEWGRSQSSNLAKAIDSLLLVNGEIGAKYTREEILEELQKSPIGKETIRAIRDSAAQISIYDSERRDGARGDQLGDEIRIFSKNILNIKIAGQTLIHEMAHYRFGIGYCQHAEAVCFAMEKMHIMGRDYLLPEEWEYVKNLAIDNYPEYNWERGGYGDYEQFSFVKHDK